MTVLPHSQPEAATARDLVARLLSMPSSLNDACRMMEEAREVIDRLTSLCESYKTQVQAGSIEIAALKSRVEELTAALTQFVACCDTAPPTSLIIELGMACKVARSALSLEGRGGAT